MGHTDLLIVSRSFPPQVSGSSVLLANLLFSYPGSVAAAAGYSHYAREDPEFTAPCLTAYLRPPAVPLLERAYDRGIQRLHWLVRGFIRRQVAHWRPAAIMGVFPSVDFFVPAFQIAQSAGLPFYAYMHDLWQENYAPGQRRRIMADSWERIILTQARRVLCMTEAQGELYRRKYGIAYDLLPHTVPLQDLATLPESAHAPGLPRRTVLFTGNYSDAMNADSLATLAAAADLLPDDVELVYCTGVSAAFLAEHGIRSARLRVTWVSREEVRRLQSAADILIAPLSHKNAAAAEVRTVFSTKILEYLIAGRPIVVFAPTDSFHAQSARQNGWAHVVDQDNPQKLAEGILKVMNDKLLGQQLVAAAIAEARRRDARIHARQLCDWVSADTGSRLSE